MAREAARPLRRYEGARAAGFAPPSYTITGDTTLINIKGELLLHLGANMRQEAERRFGGALATRGQPHHGDGNFGRRYR